MVVFPNILRFFMGILFFRKKLFISKLFTLHCIEFAQIHVHWVGDAI